MSLGMGAGGVILRLLSYVFWIGMILAVIRLTPEREYFWTWLGTRSMSVFIWHKFLLTVLLKLCCGKYYIRREMPHGYMIAAICIAVIITVISAYLPAFRLSDRMKSGEKERGR